MDLYDYKPKMDDLYDKDLPDSHPQGPALTTMTSGQARFPIAPSKYQVRPARQVRHVGQSNCCRTPLRWSTTCASSGSMNTEAINHEPAITFMQTGNQITGRPCLGSWASYGLGSLNQNLPTFVVLVARPSNTEQLQAISARLWSSGYLPASTPASRSARGDPILYINNPPGVTDEVRRRDAGRPAAAQRDELPASSATRRRTRASSNTSWRSACRRACRS